MKSLDLGSPKVAATVMKLAFPAMLAQFVNVLYSIVDRMFVGNIPAIGDTALAGLGVCAPMATFISAFAFLIGIGGAPLFAMSLGEGDGEKAKKILSNALLALVLVAVSVSAVIFAAMDPILRVFGASDKTFPYAKQYLTIYTAGALFSITAVGLNQFIIAQGYSGIGMCTTVIGALANVGLDPLFIYTFGMGVAGAALATALSQAVGAAIPLAYFLRENDTPLRLGRPCFDLRALWRACCNGSSEMVSNLSGSLVGILYNVQLMAIAQEDGVSAYGVLMYVDFIFKAFFFGYSIAVTPVVGYHYGAQNHAELKSLLRKSLIITVLVSLVMTGASVTLAGPIADLFVGYDAALHDMTVNALRVYSVSFLVFGFNIFGSAFFTGLNDGTDSALISFLRTLVFQVAAILLLPRWLDINGIWLAVTAAESLTLLVTVSLLAAKRRKYHY